MYFSTPANLLTIVLKDAISFKEGNQALSLCLMALTIILFKRFKFIFRLSEFSQIIGVNVLIPNSVHFSNSHSFLMLCFVGAKYK